MRRKQGLIALLLAVICLFGAVACADEEDRESHAVVTYDTDRIGEYVRLAQYTGLTVPLADETALKSEAIWAYLLDEAEFLRLPEEQAAYYAEQSRAACRHYAEENRLDYDEALRQLGTSEERIVADAERMVKKDLVYYYIVQHAKIEVTEQERETLSPRYIKKFAEDYGYDEEYVKEHMRSLIDDAMLYDKTTEYLILNNKFPVGGEAEET
ncbi:MAG: hypothetical protein E7668_03830 [Ruminococcaceae bacterium]|nr:hypothetical protein [Oscillospiraceae bacterium]